MTLLNHKLINKIKNQGVLSKPWFFCLPS
ncbi:DUF3955 domain-containing protein [Mesoplasma whartonense]